MDNGRMQDSGRRLQDAREPLILDRAYFRGQARDAAKLFLAPLAGVYAALTEPLQRDR